MAKLNSLDLVALLLVVVGALNWALVGIGIALGMDLNVIAMLTETLVGFGGETLMWVEPGLYILVGFAGLYMVYFLSRFYGNLAVLGSGASS